MCPCSGVSSSSSRPRPERRLTRGGASSSRGPLTARILTRHCLPPATILNSQRIFWWKSQFGVDYKESFLVIIWICIVPRQIILKIWLCQCCYCTFLWEYLLDDLLFLNEYIFALLTYILIKIEKFPPWVLEKTNVWVHVLCACIREGRVFYLLKARKHWTAFDI